MNTQTLISTWLLPAIFGLASAMSGVCLADSSGLEGFSNKITLPNTKPRDFMRDDWQAFEATRESVEKKRLAGRLLDHATAIATSDKNQTAVWVIMAAAAMELKRDKEGRRAAAELARLGLHEQKDMTSFIDLLKNLGWWTEPSIVNSLGMTFVNAGTPGVMFCTQHTRIRDFAIFAEQTGHDVSRPTANGSVSYSPVLETSSVVRWKDAGATWKMPFRSAGRPSVPGGPPYPFHVEKNNHPVVCVSFLDAVDFCSWLTKKDRLAGRIPAGAFYRLPTDAEWCRACDGSQTMEPRTMDSTTIEVGMMPVNRFGIYGLGNIMEWCSSWMPPSTNVQPPPRHFGRGGDGARGITTKNDGRTYRVIRGSDWRFRKGDAYLGTTCVNGCEPHLRMISIGFRCVLVKHFAK